MCGIAGIWNQADEGIMRAMVQAVAHRGPDGLAWSASGRHSVGAARLAIVGDPTAPAVFRDPITGLIALLNGEIYNYHSLRMELHRQGDFFRTDLEAEVICRLYARYGAGFASRLKGMFAIAILDGDRLVLARDRFGIKPLYYVQQGGKVAFGSEIKALLACPGITPQLNLAALAQIAVFGYICSPTYTLFLGIRQVQPGSVLVFDVDKTQVCRFGELPPARYLGESEEDDYEAAVAHLREHIIEMTATLLSHGNQPKGLYLSGGLDSSTIALVARAILGQPLSTFTLGDSRAGEDFAAARAVAARLGTQHVARVVDVEDYFAALDDFVYHYEMLVAGGVFDIHGAMAFHLLTETVSQHVRVAFSGEGADELFGGYYWIYTHPLGFSDRIRARLQQLPRESQVWRQVEDLFPQPEDELAYRRNLLDALVRSGLANYHLQSVDRSCGAFGFEVRPAYLYDDLADYALSLPIEYKVPDGNTTKRILRDAFRPEFKQLGLEWVLTRRKLGMPAALGNLAGLIAERMAAEVTDADFASHPLRPYLASKVDVYLFRKFAECFQLEMPDAIQVGAD